jgi:hypothetical protein
MRAIRSMFLVALVLSSTASVFAQPLPADAKSTCTGNIAPWFQSGTVTANGFVNPANSLNLNTSNNCNFYLWSQQMFLWMTSPSPTIYGGGNGSVFQSPVFFAIASCSKNGKTLCFVPQFQIPPFIPPIAGAKATANASAGKLPPLKNAVLLKTFPAALRPAKRGPHGLPVVVDRKGRVIEITDAQLSPKGKPVVVAKNGKVEVSKIVRDATTKKLQFIDAAGGVISNPKPVLSASLTKSRAGQRFFMTDGTPIVMDASGVVLDVSPEQAGSIGAVLLTQKNAIVYYTTVVNDVYAWFLTGVANGAIHTTTANQFPTTQSDLNQIVAYAAKYGVTLTDANALAIEAKLSWADVSSVSNPSTYITSGAAVPVYNTSSSQTWTYLNKTAPATLALIGVHVVGTSNGHPEMIWSTFEHFNNTPNGTYQYTNTSGGTTTVNQNTGTSSAWLLTANNSTGPFNVAHANYLSAPSIKAQSGQTISGSDTLRVYPFGVAPTGIPNQNDATPAIANTEVISLNNSVLSQLAPGDIRANYYFVGSTWTFSGFAPTQPYPVIIQQPNPNTAGSELGTSYLTNSTMETYQQAAGTTPSTNCFSCHSNGGGIPPAGTLVTTAVSHIYSSIAPLFSSTSTAKPAAKKK